jgi:carbonic anhydrase/acetyltransferase-like protein (isoleucine patch superfamily)
VIRAFRAVSPTVHPSAFVDVSAQVVGDVHLGAESSIWMNVVPGSLAMGVPAKVRPVSPEEDASIARYAESGVRDRLEYQT